MRPTRLLLACALAACGEAEPSTPGGAGGKADDLASAVDIRSTALELDLAERRGRATITLAGGPAELEVGDLTIEAVSGDDGALPFEVADGRLTVAEAGERLIIDYGFAQHEASDGLLAGGSTLLWPYFCGNLFPCHSAPADGQRFTLALAGVPADQVALFPAAIATDAPAYQLAFAVGAYTSRELGATAAGTRVSVHWLPRGKTAALAGTRHLVAAFDWLEQHLGPYRFGDQVGAVAARWGAGAFGGMEHHPMWHVAVEAMADEETQVHEAVHGWFGDGIRIRCWEDFVLSEGTTSYLAARVLGQVAGADAEAAVWTSYRATLDDAVTSERTVAWPDGCGAIDILEDGLFSNIPYMKGAYFYKAVAAEVGVEALDEVLAGFYRAHAGGAAGMQDMLDAIEADTGFDPGPLARRWLTRKGLPTVIP